jgi:translation elongation factor EF-1alpha
MVKEVKIGNVFSYFNNLKVAAINLLDELEVGNKIHIKGSTTDFEQEVISIQIDRKEIKKAKKGDSIGIKVLEKVRPNDGVFLIR